MAFQNICRDLINKNYPNDMPKNLDRYECAGYTTYIIFVMHVLEQSEYVLYRKSYNRDIAPKFKKEEPMAKLIPHVHKAYLQEFVLNLKKVVYYYKAKYNTHGLYKTARKLLG